MPKKAIRVPVKFEGREVGVAEISEDGEIITAELNNVDNLPSNLREAFLIGIADSVSLGINYTPAYPAPLTQEQKSQRWNQRTLPHGM